MRLRNIPGAKDAILECDWVNRRSLKGNGRVFLGRRDRFFLRLVWEKGVF